MLYHSRIAATVFYEVAIIYCPSETAPTFLVEQHSFPAAIPECVRFLLARRRSVMTVFSRLDCVKPAREEGS